MHLPTNYSRCTEFQSYFKQRFCIVTFSCLLLLSGCAQTVSSVIPPNIHTQQNVDSMSEQPIDFGYLMMAVKTNQTIQELRVEGPMDFILTAKDLQKGSNYILVPVQEGDYILSEIVLSKYHKFDFSEDDYWRFEVKRNAINYIGDLSTEFHGWWNSRIKYKLENRSSYALEYIEKRLPEILLRHQVVYGGIGEDQFLERMTAINLPLVQQHNEESPE